jgi:hypothetical protein
MICTAAFPVLSLCMFHTRPPLSNILTSSKEGRALSLPRNLTRDELRITPQVSASDRFSHNKITSTAMKDIAPHAGMPGHYYHFNLRELNQT